MQIRSRPAVRILCFDAAHRLLMMRWRDPVDGNELWEPPGGGIEPGETPLQAARRELAEETGLDPAAIGDTWLDVDRDCRWNGSRFIGTEQFFTAHFPGDHPALTRTGLMPDEQVNLRGTAWLDPLSLAALTDPVEPPQLPSIAAQLSGPGPWTQAIR